MPLVLIQSDPISVNAMMVISVMVFHVETLTSALKEAMIAMNRPTAKILLAPGNALARMDSMEQVNNVITSMSALRRAVLATNAVPMTVQAMRFVLIHMVVTRVPVKMVGLVMARHALMLTSVKTTITIVI